LRRIIGLMAMQVVHYSDFFRAYYLKRKKDGLPAKGLAVLAAAHKWYNSQSISFDLFVSKTILLIYPQVKGNFCKKSLQISFYSNTSKY
jgi:hypothetical protein